MSVAELEDADEPLRIVARVEHRAAEPLARQLARALDEEHNAKKPVGITLI